MKITIDIDTLLEEKKITKEEYNKLKTLSKENSLNLGINIITTFAIITLIAGFVMLRIPKSLQLIFMCFLVALPLFSKEIQSKGRFLNSLLLVIGALGISVNLALMINNVAVFFAISLILGILSYFSKSGLLAAFSALSISPLLNMASGYRHATYSLSVREPTLTIIVFSLLSLLFYLTLICKKENIKSEDQRIMVIFARTCALLVNFGFWVGSLWGDGIRTWNRDLRRSIFTGIEPIYFTVSWAVVLILIMIIGFKKDERFLVNTSATFLGIHFYTQYFEIIDFNAVSVLIAGFLGIIASYGLHKYNNKFALKNTKGK
ncbi:hypothetical protein ACFL0U_01880 [Pseudomonadota bacterium]